MPAAPGRPPRDRVLWFGVAAITVGGAALRLIHLGAHLPALVAPDEPTVVERALLVLRGDLPQEYDWPTGSMVFLAGVFKAVGHAGSYLLARGVFAAIAIAVIALTGAVAAAIAGDNNDSQVRRGTVWGATALVAVAYVSVRLSRQVQPDHLQLAFVLGAFLAIARFDRDRSRPWLAAAGVLAGLAAATKYLGGLVALPATIAVLAAVPHVPWRRRATDLTLLAATVALGAVLGAPGLLLDPTQVADGVSFQTGHQAGGHLGYDGSGNGWWFHLTTSLPGSWGWIATGAAVVGVVWVLARGTRLQRLAAAYAVPVFLIACGPRVRFPHYVLPALPFLAAFAALGVVRAARLLRAPVWLGVAVLAASLGPTALHDIRLVRAAAADDTRLIATEELRRLVPPDTVVWTERYGLLAGAGARLVPDIGTHPELLDCACVLAVSSYQEDRYRREARRYATEVAVYDELRRRATVLARLPSRPRLRYDWDLLPDWGLRRLPLTGPIGPVGPVVTLFDLRPVAS